jgi:protein disulfide-isomerase
MAGRIMKGVAAVKHGPAWRRADESGSNRLHFGTVGAVYWGLVRRYLCLLVIGCASLTCKGLEWFTDAQAALEKAKQEDKFVLLDFTGSDWCGWCKKLKREVFDQPEFAGFAESKLVLVEVDFPHHKVLDEAQKAANHKLAGTYQITGYPTIIVLNHDGKMAGRTGYVAGGPAAFDAKLEDILKRGEAEPQPAAKTEPEPPPKPAAFVPVPAPVPIHYGALALKGISGTKDRRMVLINNASLMVGETAKVKTEDREVVVCCKEIRGDSVRITADGTPMELKLAQH